MRLQYGALVQDARGKFGGTVHSAWRGTRLVRRFRAPANPNTSAQQDVRKVFQTSMKFYLLMQTYTRAAWEAYAAGKDFLGRNKFVALQVPALKGKANANDMVGTPGDASTLTPVISSVTPGSGQLTVNVTQPTPPTGWTVERVVAFVFKDTDWGGASPSVTSWEGSDTSSPYNITITGLTGGLLHQVRAFTVYTAPDTTTRYSYSAATTATPS